MNPMKQESWDLGSDFQDYHWNTAGHLPQSPYYSPEILSTQSKVELEEEGFLHSTIGPQTSIIKEPKKRGRPKKVKDESGMSESDGKNSEKKVKQESITDHLTVAKKRKDRFNGMPEEEVLQKLLPDHMAPNLDILIIGINPGLFAAYVGHHYAGPGNHFWRCMYLSGLIPEPMSAYDDYKLLSFGIGFTNICSRTTRGSADLKKQEIREGAEILRKKLMTYKPKIAVFNGKGIYEIFSGNKNFHIGKQPEKVDETVLFVMPSSSVRCAQLPRAVDKVPFYLALKKLRDHLRGDLPTLDESEVVFPTVETKTKPEVKDDASDEDEDSGLSYGDSSSREMTLEQIQNQAEYLEALIASAEGKDIPMESCGNQKIRCMKFNRGDNSIDTETSGSGDELSQSYTPQIHSLKPKTTPLASNLSLALKQETSYDDSEYVAAAVNGPTAQKVNLEDSPDPYLYHHTSMLHSMPQYMNLGDIPSKTPPGAPPGKLYYPSMRSQIYPQPCPGQQTSTGFIHTSYAQNRTACIPQGPRHNAHNGSSFLHHQSRTNNKDNTLTPTYLNI